MARIPCDGMTKVTWVAAIADVDAPTVAELTAGIDLQGFITPDGANIANLTEATVDASVLASTSEFEKPGRYKLSSDLTMQMDDVPGDNLGWNTAIRLTDGFLVVRRDKPEDLAYVAAQKVAVYTTTWGKRAPNKPAKNMLATFIAHLYHSGKDNDSATVTA